MATTLESSDAPKAQMTQVIKATIERTLQNRGDGGAMSGAEEVEGLRVQLAHAHTTISRLSAALGVGRAATLINEELHDGMVLFASLLWL